MKNPLQKICVLILFSLFSLNGFSQELPPALRNFLIDFGKSSSLSNYDTELEYNRVNERMIDVFMNSFISSDAIIFNDVYHGPDAPVYVTVQEYCDLVAEYYPEGFLSFVYSPKLQHVYHKNGNIYYEIEVDKYLSTDFGMENPPHIYFDPYSKLKLSIVFVDNGYKILMIEEARSAFAGEYWIRKIMPQNLTLLGGYTGSSLSVDEVPAGFTDFQSGAGAQSYGALRLSWDLGGKGKLKFGLLSGIEYAKTTNSMNLDSYSATRKLLDKDNYPYLQMVSGKDISQEYSFSSISVPLGIHVDYSFPSKWKPIVASARDAQKRFPVKRNVRLSLNAGVKFNSINASEVNSNSGTYSYAGEYGFWNEITNDTSFITIRDLPAYGFYSDTAFSVNDMPSSYKSNYFSAFAEFNVTYPVNQYIEVFAGPVFNVSVSKMNEVENDFVFSSQAGDSRNLLSTSGVSMAGIGANAGIILNIKPPRNAFYPYPELHSLKPYSASKSSAKFKGSFTKTVLNVNVSSDFRQKLLVSLNGEWMAKPQTNKISTGKTKKLTLKYPVDPAINGTGMVNIIKPFGIEVTATNCDYYNNVDHQQIAIPLDSLIRNRGCFVTHNVNLKVEKLPAFNLVYVTLNGRDDANARKDLTDELRKIYRKARFDNEEILIYISTEINKPVVFCNFEVPSIQNISYKVFTADSFDEFINEVRNKYNSAIEDYTEDLHNLEVVMGANFGITQRLNASRRYVNFYFLPVDASYYRVPGYIEEADNSIIQNLIISLTNKYCLDVPVEQDQYKVYVHIRADQYKEISLDRRVPVNECNNKIVLY